MILQETLVSYRGAVDQPMHRNLYEVAVAGALRKYDLEDILPALRPRPVTLLNPVDALGKPVRLEELRRQLGAAVDLRSRTRRDALHSFLQ